MAIASFNELKLAVANWMGRDEFTTRIPEWVAMAEDRIAQDLRVRANETSQVIKWTATKDGATVGGTANAITLTPATAATAYAFADTYKFTATGRNTSTVTVAISGLAATAIKKSFGGVKEGLTAGDIIIGAEYRIYYDGTDFLLVAQGAAPLPSNYVQQRRLYLEVSDDKPLDFFDPQVFWTRNAVNETGQPDIYTIEGDFIIAAPVPDGTYYGKMNYYRRFTALSANSDTNWVLVNARGLYLYGTLLEAYTFLEDDAGQLKYSAMYEDILDRLHEADRKARYPMGALPTRSQVGVI